MTASITISGDRVLIDGTLRSATVTVDAGLIVDIGPRRSSATFDAGRRLVLPGIVDLHGDAFERQIMPRPGVSFDPLLALMDTDRQLISNGITTAFHGVTYSWEPGLRGGEAGRALIAAIRANTSRLSADTRLHLRWETYNLDAEEEVLDWLNAGWIDLLAFNDHTPSMVSKIDQPAAMLKFAERTGLSLAAFQSTLEDVAARSGEVKGAIERLAATARNTGVATLSHDDNSVAERSWYRSLGCTIAEFPKNEETAIAARAAGDHVVMGAPNVVRGGSHVSLVSAAVMVERGLCTILSSDYYYPALLHGAFRLVREGICTLGEAFQLVSESSANAGRLDDRGRLVPGKRADLIFVDDSDAELPRVLATFMAGRPVFFDASAMHQSAAEESLCA